MYVIQNNKSCYDKMNYVEGSQVCFPEDLLFILEGLIIFYVIKQTVLESGKTVQWLKALAVLAKDWSLVSSTHYW